MWIVSASVRLSQCQNVEYGFLHTFYSNSWIETEAHPVTWRDVTYTTVVPVSCLTVDWHPNIPDKEMLGSIHVGMTSLYSTAMRI